MSQTLVLEPAAERTALEWAVEKRADIVVCHPVENGWASLRAHIIQFDPDQRIIQISYPYPREGSPPSEINDGEELGISFRRGHKKCIFVSRVIMRTQGLDQDGCTMDALVLRAPTEIRALQRRAYQRVTIPADRFIAVKLWEGGVPEEGAVGWPLCSGRVANMSVGGVLLDIRADQNPRLATGDIVGIEITHRAGGEPLRIEGQYRHCLIDGEDRLGIGFQFVGLEYDRSGRSTLAAVAEYVRDLRRNP